MINTVQHESKPGQFGDIIAELLAEPSTAKGASIDVRNRPDAGLVADEAQIRRFFTALFKRCVLKGGVPFGGRIALRAFRQSDDKPVLSEWEPLAGNPIARASELATQIARRPAAEAAVFSPPVCLFKDDGRARMNDVLACPVIVVDLDKSPVAGRRTLEAVLGPATVIVASGGVWMAPDGTREDKLHIYWRLAAPSVDEGDKALLRDVRAAAAALVGADRTAVPLSHPMRWPGSWHTKAEPRLCSIIGGDETRELYLADAANRVSSLP